MRTEFGSLIKLAVDLERVILAGDGELHTDCEQALLLDGSKQNDIWGGDSLASTLARLSSHASDARFDPIVSDLLHEGTLLMEWSAPNVPLDVAADLAAMQRELVLWRRIWPNDEARPVLAFRARQMADRLLEAAGL